jgi:hypothetical protein
MTPLRCPRCLRFLSLRMAASHVCKGATGARIPAKL